MAMGPDNYSYVLAQRRSPSLNCRKKPSCDQKLKITSHHSLEVLNPTTSCRMERNIMEKRSSTDSKLFQKLVNEETDNASNFNMNPSIRKRGNTPSSISKYKDVKAMSSNTFTKVIDNCSDTSFREARKENDLDTTSSIGRLPGRVKSKLLRQIAIKRKDFLKFKSTVISQQNKLLTQYAALKELEMQSGTSSSKDELGEVRIVSVPGWPAHDILLLIRDGYTNLDLDSEFAPQTLVLIYSQLSSIPEELRELGENFMKQYTDVLLLLRFKTRLEANTQEMKTEKQLDMEADKLRRLIAKTVECFQTKITRSLQLAKMAWLDRENLMKRVEKKEKENMILKTKLEEYKMKDKPSGLSLAHDPNTSHMIMQTLAVELQKERSAREALRSKVPTAESALQVARSRIRTLERQLKDTQVTAEANKKKQKELEQTQTRPKSEPRTKKWGEKDKLEATETVESISSRRNALSMRLNKNKAIRDEMAAAARAAEAQVNDLQQQLRLVSEKLAESEKARVAAEARVAELEGRTKELEEQLGNLKECSAKLVDAERQIYLEVLPTAAEAEPSSKEMEMWKELQATREALAKAEEDLRLCQTEKTNFLESFASLMKGNGGSGELIQEQLTAELINKEQKIMGLLNTIEKYRENEKKTEKIKMQYETQLAEMRTEVKRLRNYDCYVKEVSYPELQTEIIELQMKVSSLERERASLMNRAASQALSLERHARAANMFAKITRARRELSASIVGVPEPSLEVSHQLSQRESSSSVYHGPTASATWSALRTERARVLIMERGLVSQYSNNMTRSPSLHPTLPERTTIDAK